MHITPFICISCRHDLTSVLKKFGRLQQDIGWTTALLKKSFIWVQWILRLHWEKIQFPSIQLFHNIHIQLLSQALLERNRDLWGGPFNFFINYYNGMKTPQRWRTSRVYVIVVFAILTLFDVMTSFCDVTRRHIIGQDINGLVLGVLMNWQTDGKTHRNTETQDRFYYLDRWRGR